MKQRDNVKDKVVWLQIIVVNYDTLVIFLIELFNLNLGTSIKINTKNN